MSFTAGSTPTYSELFAAIQTWLKGRTDIASGSTGTALIDDWIRMVEADINHGFGVGGAITPGLRVREMEASATSTPDSNGQFSLPSGYIGMRAVISKNSPRRPLRPIDPLEAENLYGSRESDVPDFYTIEGSTVQILPVSTTDVEVHYYTQIPALYTSNTTNWLLTKSPNTYIYGCRRHGAAWLQDNALEQASLGQFLACVEALRADDVSQRYARANIMSLGQKA